MAFYRRERVAIYSYHRHNRMDLYVDHRHVACKTQKLESGSCCVMQVGSSWRNV